jgi:hypothetical protein
MSDEPEIMNNKSSLETISETYKLLEFFEESVKPFEWKFCGLPTWWFLREIVYSHFEKLLYSDARQMSMCCNSGYERFLKNFSNYKKVFGNKLTSDFSRLHKSNILFLSFARDRRDIVDGKYYDVLIDPIIEKLDDYICLEMGGTNQVNHGRQRYTHNIFSLSPWTIDFAFVMMMVMLKNQWRIRNGFDTFYKQIIDFTRKVFKRSQSEAEFRKVLFKRFFSTVVFCLASEPFVKKLLNVIRPKILVSVHSYSVRPMIFQYIAKQRGIKTFELQHGLITPYHLGYIFSKKSGIVLEKTPLPDYKIVWGEHFKNLLVEKSIWPEENVIIGGFTYLNRKAKQRQRNPAIGKKIRNVYGIPSSKKIILVTSSGTRQQSMVRFLTEVLKELPHDYHLILKLHPQGFDNYSNDYTELNSYKNLSIIKSFYEPSLYDILAIVDIHASELSTVLYEAMALGIPNIIIDSPSLVHVVDLYYKGLAEISSTPEEFITIIKKINTNHGSYQSNQRKFEYFFETDENFIPSLLKMYSCKKGI